MGDHGIMPKLLLHYQGLVRLPFIWNDSDSSDKNIRDSCLSSSIDTYTQPLLHVTEFSPTTAYGERPAQLTFAIVCTY